MSRKDEWFNKGQKYIHPSEIDPETKDEKLKAKYDKFQANIRNLKPMESQMGEAIAIALIGVCFMFLFFLQVLEWTK